MKEGRAFRNIGKKICPYCIISLANFLLLFNLLLIRSSTARGSGTSFLSRWSLQKLTSKEIRLNWYLSQDKMSCFLSPRVQTFVGIQQEHRVSFSLLQCTDSIENHLAFIHVPRKTITEGQLILARAGLCDLDESILMQMSACAKHRHTYEEFWRPRTACQYPALQGCPGRSQKEAKSRYSVNLEMA